MKYWSCEVEVWVKPLFRKARPKIMQEAWAANDLIELYREMQKHHAGKRWQLLTCKEITAQRAEAGQ